MILNQQGENVICIYILLGKKHIFIGNGIMKYTVVTVETANSPATL